MTKRGLILPCLALMVSMLFVVPGPVRAQGKKAGATAPVPEKAPEAAADAEGDGLAKVKVERGAGGQKVYKIEGEIVIEGKIQKPEAFYVLQKSGINYDWHELKQEFVPKILDSVTKAPF